ncbi:TonB-dependent receptor [Polaromonas sp. YR568]|uniref:TonB-dependent receptor n=1 Tax=Polaromonas sp. YR568 TaxID=1855301 RepID=UPI00398C1ECE
MNLSRTPCALAWRGATALAFPLAAFAQAPADAPARSLGVVTVNSGQPTSLPTQIPTTLEGITREQIEQTINATDSEDALKYFPSLLVRKRYIGDYNHAILSSRASGTGNSARSAVYADGILLSNYLGNGIANGTNYAPRWGLVTPEEIERVDVLYGPFSAAYPGNSVGAVVDYVTRMPAKFEAHAKLSGFTQDFKLYGTSSSFSGSQASASLGSRNGDWSWFINANRTESAGQPLTFATRTLSTAAPAPGATVVSGAVPGLNTRNVPWLLLGGATQYETRQEHLKLKVAYDFSSTVRASYTLGYWKNDAENRSQSYLRNAAGAPVYSGNVSIDGRGYTLAASDFGVSNEALVHVMHGLSVKSNTQGTWDWEVAASLYDYQKDQVRAATSVQPGALNGGAGTLQDQDGTGWNTLAFKGIWRPDGIKGAHIVDFGFQQDSYTLRILKSNTANWLNSGPGSAASDVGGKTRLRSVYAQDAWAFAPRWKTVLGARLENWTASSGFTSFGAGNPANTGYAARSDNAISPKAALSYQWSADTTLKASAGRAVRFPTVGELYGATATVNSQYINDPNLRPEKSWTTELTAEKDLGNALLRLTFFTENVRDSLYSQTTFDPVANANISRVQNVGRIKTQGVEVAFSGNDVLKKGLDLSGSVTYADSRIKDNKGFVAVAGDTLGKYQPRVPVWRATALASYRFDAAWTATVGARYSGTQFSSLDNSDVNGFAYQGTSKYFTTDVRVRYQVNKQWSAAVGIDNLNNYQYWNFHPYPQRTFMAELNFSL